MKITGVAPKIALPTLIYLIITIVIDDLTSPLFDITWKYKSTIIIIALVIILIGIILVINIAKKLRSSFGSNTLMTDGLYKIVRNPMYISYMIFIIPGIGLLFNSWLVLSSAIINFVLFEFFIREEYNYLSEKYGERYTKYIETVLFKFM